MAKDYKRGADYRLYYDSAANWSTPTWVHIKAVGDIDLASNPDDIVVPERTSSTGHLQGEDDPAITFNMFEDAGDTNVTALVTALFAGTQVHLAVSRGNIATSGTKYWHIEACLTSGVQLSAARGEPAQYAVEARRHANSDNDLTQGTTA